MAVCDLEKKFTFDFWRNMIKQRQSNFELLRIVSMLLIVLHHFGYYAPDTAGDPIKTGVLLLLAWGGGSSV